MYELDDLFLVETFSVCALVTFRDGAQWCSHCGPAQVDQFTPEEMTQAAEFYKE